MFVCPLRSVEFQKAVWFEARVAIRIFDRATTKRSWSRLDLGSRNALHLTPWVEIGVLNNGTLRRKWASVDPINHFKVLERRRSPRVCGLVASPAEDFRDHSVAPVRIYFPQCLPSCKAVTYKQTFGVLRLLLD